MRAVFLRGAGDLVVGSAEVPRPGSGWALVRSELSGICGTDKAFYRGSYRLLRSPLIPGHEVVGTVVEGPEHLVGRRVVSEINFPCWACEYCRSGLYTHCPRKLTLGIDFDGGMAEFFTAPQEALHPVDLEPGLGIFVEPLASLLRAFSLKPPAPGSAAAVIGSGSVAHLAAQLLRISGASAVDLVVRRESGKLGFFKPYVDRILRVGEAESSRYDVVLEASGDPEALSEAVRIARPRGAVHLKSTPGSPGSLSLTQAVVKEVEIVGSRCGTWREFREAIRLLSTGAVKPRLDRVYGISEAPRAFEESLKGEVLKVAISPLD